MSSDPLLDDVRQAAKDYQSAERRFRQAVTAARAAQLPMTDIARAAGVTRQTAYNWTAGGTEGSPPESEQPPGTSPGTVPWTVT